MTCCCFHHDFLDSAYVDGPLRKTGKKVHSDNSQHRFIWVVSDFFTGNYSRVLASPAPLGGQGCLPATLSHWLCDRFSLFCFSVPQLLSFPKHSFKNIQLLVLRRMENRLLSQFHVLPSAVLDKGVTRCKSSVLESLNLQIWSKGTWLATEHLWV